MPVPIYQHACMPSNLSHSRVSKTSTPYNAKTHNPLSTHLRIVTLGTQPNAFEITLVTVLGLLIIASFAWIVFVFGTLCARSMRRRTSVSEPEAGGRLVRKAAPEIPRNYSQIIGREFPLGMRSEDRYRERPEFVEAYDSDANGGESGLLGGPYGSSGWRRVRRYDGTFDGGECGEGVGKTSGTQNGGHEEQCGNLSRRESMRLSESLDSQGMSAIDRL